MEAAFEAYACKDMPPFDLNRKPLIPSETDVWQAWQANMSDVAS